MFLSQASPKSQHMSKRYLELREQLWPGCEPEVWSRKTSKGFTTIPRILPLILHLITILDKTKHGAKGNPSKVYLDLWCRAYDEGFLDVNDEDECAYSAGYTGSRAARTWKEHVKLLRDLGFVRTAKKGNREIGYILIVDPYWVAESLHEEKRVQEDWWNAFIARVHRTKAKLPSQRKKVAEPLENVLRRKRKE